jgi:hypothetical protein
MNRREWALLIAVIIVGVRLFIATNQGTTSLPATPTPVPIPPTAVVPVNSVPGTKLIAFTAAPDTIDQGGEVMLTWSVRGIEAVAIEQYYGYKTAYDVRYADLPPSGTLTVRLSNSQPKSYAPSVPYLYGATFLLVPNNGSGWYSDTGIFGSTSVSMRCPYDGFFFGVEEDSGGYIMDFCPLAPAQQVDALYQPFEKGFIIWRGDTRESYAFSTLTGDTEGSAIRYSSEAYAEDAFADVPVPPQYASEIPFGFYQPVGDIGHVWKDARWLLSLGWAKAEATPYTATVQDSYAGSFGSLIAYMTLPDGRIIRYYNDNTVPFWNVVKPLK